GQDAGPYHDQDHAVHVHFRLGSCRAGRSHGTGTTPCRARTVDRHLRRASLYRSLPFCMTYSVSFVASCRTQVSEVVTKPLGSGMGVNHVAPPLVLSLMPASDSTNTCLGSLTFSAWAQTSCQVSLTTLKFFAPAEEQ